MNRTSFLFLILLIVSCVLTVNSRHQARTLISEKSSLQEKMNGQNETIRRLELEKSRLAAKLAEPLKAPEAAADTLPAVTPAVASAAAVAEPQVAAEPKQKPKPKSVTAPVAAPKPHK